MIDHMKPLLIGPAPARTGDPTRVLADGPTGSKLARLCRLSKDEYLAAFDRMNLMAYWPGKHGKGDAFMVDAACLKVAELLPAIRCRPVVFVGHNVARSFRFDAPILTWRPFNGGVAAVLPHPSGVNRWYNEVANRRRASRFLTTIATF